MTEREQIEQSIAALEAQRAILGDAVVEPAIVALREKLAALDAPPASPPLGGTRGRGKQQRKQITVLFADVSGFTAMSETMDVEDVTEMMNALWERLDAAIIDHGGTIDKHIGDAVMALWSVEQAREDDPEYAVRAALDMQAVLAAFREERGVQLAMRIGLNTGPVLLGEVGTTGEYTAMGDTVNLASRLEHVAPVDGILISHDTYRHVRGIFDVQVPEPIQVRGKAEPVRVYAVQRAKPRAFRRGVRGVEGVETRMIGREAELKHLQDVFRTATDPAGNEHQMVTIVGEAGVGKSRLLYEFENWVDLLPETAYYFKGRADQEMQNLPYALVRDLFSFRFQIRDSDRAGVVREKIERGIAEALGEEDGAQTHMRPHMRPHMRAHFIGQLLGFDFSDSPHLQGVVQRGGAGSAKQIRDRALIYIIDYFKAVAAQAPVLIMLEDLHWADESSLDVLDRLALATSDQPLLILCTTRPTLFERRPHWGEVPSASSGQAPSTGSGQALRTKLALSPLSKQDSRRLVEEVLKKVEQVPEALRELVVGGAEGNPFYVEELIKMFIEDGVIIKGQDGQSPWQVEPTRLTAVRVPPTLTGVLQARLDSLPPEERAVLQQAAVVGRIFWDDTVERIDESASQRHAGLPAAIGERGVPEALSALRGREMVFQRESSVFSGTREYIFKHAVLREVAYESVLKRVRRVYHALVAEWLTEHSSERVEQYAGLIGEHYGRAGETIQAVEWYARAGRQAQAAYANEDALLWYNRTLETLDRLNPEEAALFQSPRLSAHEALGEVLALVGRYDEALEHYAAARTLLETGTLSAERACNLADLYRQTAVVYELRSEYDRALEWLEKGLNYVDEDESAIEAVRIYLLKAGVYSRQSKNEDAIAWGQKSLDIASQIKTREGQQAVGNAYYLLAGIYLQLGDLSQAVQLCHESVQVYQQLEDLVGQSNAYNNLANAYSDLGNWTQASDMYHKSLAIAQEIGSVDNQGRLANNLGNIHLNRGEWSQAARLYERSHAIWEQIGVPLGVGVTLSNLAQVHICQENWSEAEACLRRSQATFIRIDSHMFIPELERRWGEFYLKTGKPDEALEHTRRSIELAVEQNNPLEEGVSRRALGQVHLARGEWALAEPVLRQSLQILGDLNSEFEAAKTQLVLARLVLEGGVGTTEEAQTHLMQAIEIFEKLGAQVDLLEARELKKQL